MNAKNQNTLGTGMRAAQAPIRSHVKSAIDTIRRIIISFHLKQEHMGNMEYTPQHIVNYFLSKAEKEGRSLTPLKLIKLVYIAYGWVLALTGKRLFEEPIQAWQHGPVIPSVYHEFKGFGKNSIDRKATLFDLETFDFETPIIERADKETRQILDKVWSAYKMFSGWSLRNKTHQPGTPWSETYDENVSDKEIPDRLIASHFKKRIREILDAADRRASEH